MACLIDTGVLLRAFDASFAEYRVIRQAIRTLWIRQERLVVSLQNVAEFWNVSTRPVDKNGYGLSTERAAKRLAYIERFCEVVTEDDHSYRIWKGLLRREQRIAQPRQAATTGVASGRSSSMSW
jgi:predicted nucleic acid-binding protein